MPSEIACPGSCNSRWRRASEQHKAALAAYDKAVANRSPEDPEPERPVPPEFTPDLGNPWCSRCQSAIRRELAELDDLASLLDVMPPGIRGLADEDVRVSGTRMSPSPSPGGDELLELAGWLRDWESVARGDDPRARRGFLATETTTITAWLVSHFEMLIFNADVAKDFGFEIRRWHRELTDRTVTGQANKHMNQVCPRCTLYTLWWTIGENYVRCVNQDCGRLMTRSELQALKDQVAA